MAIDEASMGTEFGIFSFCVAAAGFLWRQICRSDRKADEIVKALKLSHETIHIQMWDAINENNKLIHSKVSEGERRFATRDEVMQILQHMDKSTAETNNRLDQLIQTMLNNGRH